MQSYRVVETINTPQILKRDSEDKQQAKGVYRLDDNVDADEIDLINKNCDTDSVAVEEVPLKTMMQSGRLLNNGGSTLDLVAHKLLIMDRDNIAQQH